MISPDSPHIVTYSRLNTFLGPHYTPDPSSLHIC